MAEHQTNCEICDRIAQCRAGTHPGFVAELETGFAVLGDSQYHLGYSLLLCKTPATELDELPPGERAAFLNDMARLAAAVRQVLKPNKVNYEALGNAVHHLHWHIFPRTLEEPFPVQPVWNYPAEVRDAPDARLDPMRHGPLIEAIRKALAESASR